MSAIAPRIPVRSLLTFVFLSAIIASVLWPLVAFDWWAGYESIRYQLRLDALATNLLAQGTHPRWIPETAGGYGTPYFNFYAPGFTYLCLPFIWLGVHVAVKAAIVLVTAVGTFSVYSLAREWNGRAAGCLAVLLFTTCPYLLFCLYVRTALAEYAALHLAAAMVWVFWTVSKSGVPWRGVILASCAYACWFTLHNVSSLFLSLLFVLVVAGFAWRHGLKGRALLRLLLIFPLGALLSAWFWLPAVLELPDVQHQVLRAGIFDPLANLNHGWGYFLRPSRSEASFGPWMTLALLACLAGAAVNRIARGPVLVLCLPACLMLLMTYSVASLIWQHVPLISFVQFPWRLTGGASLLVALAASYLLACPMNATAPQDGAMPPGRAWAVVLGVAACLCALWAVSLSAIVQEPIVSQELRLSHWDRLRGTLHPSGDVLTAGEFLPATSDYRQTPEFDGDVLKTAPAPAHAIRLGAEFLLAGAGPAEGPLVLKQYWWPCWRAEINGSQVPTRAGPGGCLEVDVGHNPDWPAHPLRVWAARTPLEAFSEWVSGLAWLAVFVTFCVLNWRARQARAGAGS
ncbi:MAG: hypothetical protein IPP14_06950 [Planctomycetes bacterium]|nr:hypothetical protein [Planctomycetota bacterium]